MRAVRRRIISGLNRLWAAGMGFATQLWVPLAGRSPCRYPPTLLLRRRASGHAHSLLERDTDGVGVASQLDGSECDLSGAPSKKLCWIDKSV